MNLGEEVYSNVTRGAATSGFKLVGNASKGLLKWAGVPIAAMALGAMSEYEHRLENERLKKEFQLEIAAKTGKDFEAITVDDLREVAKENPILQEALDANAKKRNLNIAVNVSATVIAYSLASAASALLLPVGIPVMASMFMVGFASYLASEKILGNVGKNLFDMDKPVLQEVEKSPNLQQELSAPDQIRYLARLQEKRIAITPEALKILLQTTAKEGKALPAINVEETAALLTSGRMRANELAFPEGSGVPLLDTAPPTRIEAIKHTIQEKVQGLQEQAAAAQEQAKIAQEKVVELTQQLANTTQEKLQETKEKAGTFVNRYLKPAFNPKELAEQRANQKLLTPQGIIESRELATAGQNIHQ